MQMRNIGSPIRRKVVGDDGVETLELVAGRGDIFEPTEDEQIRLAYKLQPVRPEMGRRTRVERRGGSDDGAGAEAESSAPVADEKQGGEGKETAKAVETPAPANVEKDAPLEDFHAGRGWYVMPGTGERVHGKKRAAERLAEIRAEG